MKKNASILTNINQLIKYFCQYLLDSRGLSPRTVCIYSRHIHRFLQSFSRDGSIIIKDIQPKDIIQFLLNDRSTHTALHTQHFTYSLRSFLKFLYQTRQLKKDLSDYVPSIACRKKKTYPQALSIKEISKLIQTCDRSTPIGIRDFAILTFMANLGLRSIEICNLCLNDIDWENSEITIKGKGSQTRFPLLKELGKALIEYLKYGRPICNNEKMFVCTIHPFRGVSTSCVQKIFRLATTRAGIHLQVPAGTHILRHSFAMELLRSGVSLEEIGVLLRHKDIATTAIYARANFDKLRIIAQPWPHQFEKKGVL